MKKLIAFILITLLITGGQMVAQSNGISFGGTRAMQVWSTSASVSTADTKFQIISVHVQNTNGVTGDNLNGALLRGWGIHTHYMHGDFLVFLLVKD